MARGCNVLSGLLNIFTLLLGLGVLGWSAYSHFHGSDCQKVFKLPMLALGIFLLVVSVLGLIGGFGRKTWAMFLYAVFMFVLIVGLIFVTIFTFVVTNKGAGNVLSGRGFKEYRLGDYSHWLQNYVVNDKNWNGIRSCLLDSQVCRSLGSDVDLKASDFYMKYLSPIQSGCCKPPTECGFGYQNATFWVIPKAGPAVADEDCKTWSNNQAKLCYDCKSCKGGILEIMKKQWRHLTIFNLCVLIVVIIVYGVGFCAYRNNRSDRKYNRHKGYA